MRTWSNGSLGRSWSMCSLDSAKVWTRVGSMNRGGVWGMGWICRGGTPFGFGGKVREASSRSGIGGGHS